MFRRLVCRIFGHKAHATPVRRGRLRTIVVGCTRCDRVIDVETASLPRMTVPRKR